MNKNLMKNNSRERLKPRKNDEQKHHGEVKNNNNEETRTIGRPLTEE
jgi:hypothetical protein